MINRDFFYSQVRHSLFRGRLRQSQVDGLNFILDAWERDHAQEDDRWLAYALATTHHETDTSIRPIHEYGGRRYFFEMYDIEGRRPRKARELGNLNPGDGARFHGRGFVQLTGRKNYEAMQREFQVDLTSSDKAADHALDPALAAKIMFCGMERGTFTGKKLADYFNRKRAQWERARAIVNGRDKAHLIAGFALDYYAAVSYTTG